LETPLWAKEGCNSVLESASKKVNLLLDNEVRTVIDDEKSKKIKKIIDRFESEIE